MTQPQRQALDELLRHGPLDVGGDVTEQRAIFHEMISSVPLPEDVAAKPGELGGVPVVTVQTPGVDPTLVVLYFHGGAYALGSAADSVGLAADVSRRVGARAVSVDYRLAPEHPFPAAQDDVIAAFRWLVAAAADPREIALVGESTGATLALAAAIALRDEGGPVPGTVALMSPVVDLRESGVVPGEDPIGAWKTIHSGARSYLGDVSADDPRVSPAVAELSGLPSLLIQVGTADPFLDQVWQFIQRAIDAGVDVTSRESEGMPHRWQTYPHIYDAGRATNQVGEFLLQRIGPGYVPVKSAA
jgi:acetyl esterase/lipase